MAYDPPSIIAVSIVLPLLALVAVCLRFLVRQRVQPTYIGIDDWLVLGAVVFSLADGANLAAAAMVGVQGRDYPGEIPPERNIAEKKSDYAQVIIEKPMYALMKLSVLFFYRRIFYVQERFRWWNNIVIGLILAWATSFFFAEVFECGANPEAQWDPAAKPAHCVNQTWMNFFFAVTDVIGDILVVTMPYPCIRKLQMSKREKLGVAMIFLLGTLSTAASIVRLYFISVAFTEDFGAAGNTHMSGTPPAVWSTVEGAIGVLAACLPPLGPLIRKSSNFRLSFHSLRHRLSRTPPYIQSKETLDHTRSTEKGDTPRDSEAKSRKDSKVQTPTEWV